MVDSDSLNIKQHVFNKDCLLSGVRCIVATTFLTVVLYAI